MIIKNFKNPSGEFSPVPFWFINIIPDRKLIEYQLKEMKDKGVEQFFIHARMGLEVPEYMPEPKAPNILEGTLYPPYFMEKRKKIATPYLQEKWWEIVEDILRTSSKLGMKAWIYDEFDWPSGTAGMKIPVEFPEFRARYLEVSVKNKGKINLKNLKFAYLSKGDEVINLKEKDIASYTYELKKGEKAIVFSEIIYDNYIDVLNEKAVEKFIEYTHKNYYKRFKKYFGEIIPGFFSDEVTLIHHLNLKFLLKRLIPWSENLEKEFFQRCGYRLEDKIYLLVIDKNESGKTRCDFLQTLTYLYAKNFHKKIKEWCNKYKVLYTGHLFAEETYLLQLSCQGNIFEVLRNFHIPGIDHLGKVTLGIHPKIASSVAHFMKSTRVLGEAFGGTVKVDLNELKRITNYLYVNGINLLNPHAFYMSTEGFRRYDAPPSQFVQAKFWNKYKTFSDYVKRLSYFACQGIHNPDVAIYYPVDSIMANYNVSSLINKEINFIYNELFNISFSLSSLFLDFDFLDEEMLKNAVFEKGKMGIKDEEYKVLILPALSYISKEVMEKIKEAHAYKVKIIATSTLPVRGIEVRDKEVRNFGKRIFGIEGEALKKPLYHIVSIDTVLSFLTFPMGLGKPIDRFTKALIKFLNKASFTSGKLTKNENAFFIKTFTGFKPYGKHYEILSDVLSDIEEEMEIIPVKGDSKFLQVLKRKTKKENLYLLVNNYDKEIKFTIKFKNPARMVKFEDGSISRSFKEKTLTLENTSALGFVVDEVKVAQEVKEKEIIDKSRKR